MAEATFATCSQGSRKSRGKECHKCGSRRLRRIPPVGTVDNGTADAGDSAGWGRRPAANNGFVLRYHFVTPNSFLQTTDFAPNGRETCETFSIAMAGHKLTTSPPTPIIPTSRDQIIFHSGAMATMPLMAGSGSDTCACQVDTLGRLGSRIQAVEPLFVGVASIWLRIWDCWVRAEGKLG